MKNAMNAGLIMMIAIAIGCNPSGADSTSTAGSESRMSRQGGPSGDSIARVGNLAPSVGLAQPDKKIETNVNPDDLLASTKDDDFNLRLLSWNIESDGAIGDVIAEQLSELNKDDRYDAIGLTEVLSKDVSLFGDALGTHYKYVFTKSGRNDRMEILYNENKFELVRHFELQDINIKNRYRAPLVAHLKRIENGEEFLVMINHLARGKAEIRQEQAKMLVEWARNETMPIVAIGDYNFDYVFETDKGNPAFANFLRDNVWTWVKPEKMIDTNWYDNPQEPDGVDDYPGSILDFAFLANAAKDWKRVCRVIVRENDFPDDETTSDHRPFELLIAK